MTLWDTYEVYFQQFQPILARMSHRGIPIDEARRLELGKFIEDAAARIDREIAALVPIEFIQKGVIKKSLPKNGIWREIEVEVKESGWKCVRCAIKPTAKSRKVSRKECGMCLGVGELAIGSFTRVWVGEFNPNSSQQVKAFIRYLKHPVPKHAKRTDASGEAAETTEVKELERLAVKTKHPLYPLLIEKRQLTKAKGTYVDGWKPSKDGRIHTTMTFGSATWQLTSKAPNIQNGLKRGRTPEQKKRAEMFNAMQRAESGRVLLNFDAKSFHGQTTAVEASKFCANRPDLLSNAAEYLRLAKVDLHSFNTCFFTRHPERYNLLKMSDGDLKGFFGELKKDKTPRYKGPTNDLITFKDARDGKIKSAGLGIGFGMRGPKIYKTYQEDFANEKEAKDIWNLLMMELWPAIFNYQEKVKEKAAVDEMLVSEFGAVRPFVDVQRFDRRQQRTVSGDQGEAAIAFLPAANAFGMMREQQMEMDKKGILEEFEFINTVHDSNVFHPLLGRAERCIEAVVPIMQTVSKKMISLITPDGLWVECEGSIGDDMSVMKAV